MIRGKNIFVLITITLTVVIPLIHLHKEDSSNIIPHISGKQQPSNFSDIAELEPIQPVPDNITVRSPYNYPNDETITAIVPPDSYEPKSTILDLPSSWCLLINTSGYHALSSDMLDCSSDVGIFINASNVVLDGANHTVDGVGTESSRWGIYILNSNNVTIYNLTLSGWYFGSILIYNSTNIRIISNTLFGGGIFVVNSYNNTVEDTTLNWKAVVYLEGVSNVDVGVDAGQVILVNSNNITVRGKRLVDTFLGIELWGTNNSLILDSTISKAKYGIYAYRSNNNTIYNLTVTSTTWGLALLESNYNTIDSLNASNCDFGIYSFSSVGNIVKNSTIYGGQYGVYLNATLEERIVDSVIGPVDWGVFLYYANFTYVESNSIQGGFGSIRLVYSYGTRIISNHFEKSGLSILESYGSEVENNFVNGKPLVYLEGVDGAYIDFQAGQIVLLNSARVTIESQNISDIRDAVIVKGSHQVTLLDSYIIAVNIGIYLENSSSVTIRNSSIASGSYCVEILESEGVVLEDTNVSYGDNGLYIVNASDISIIDGRITGNDVGVYAVNVEKIRIVGVSVDKSGSRGVELRYCNDSMVADSVFYSDDSAGIYAYYCQNLTISNSTFETSDYGVELSYSQLVVISKSTFISIYDQGVYVERSFGVVVRENKFYDSGDWIDGGSVYVYLSPNTTVSGNFMFYRDPLSNNYGPAYGIQVRYSENTTVNNNTIWYQGFEGISVVGSGVTITNNRILFVSRIGIGISGSGNLVANNTVSNCPVGIYLDSSINNIIMYNVLDSDSSLGIYVMSGMNNSVLWNIIEGSMYGIAIMKSSYNTIIGNTVKSNMYGVYINRGNNNTLYLNSIIDNIYEQLYVYSSSGNRFYSPNQMKYFYGGNEFLGYVGNYWSTYVGKDLNNDGLGDVPYGDDMYPLIGIPRLIDGNIVISAPPKISILEPKNNTIFASGTINLTWSAFDYEDDLDRIEIIVDGGSSLSLFPNTTSVLLGLTEGSHTIVVRAIDSLGNVASSSVHVVVDLTAPTISIIDLIASVTSINNSSDIVTINSTLVTIIFNASDNVGIDHYEVLVDGRIVNASLPPQVNNITLNLNLGIHEITIRAYDYAGNTAGDTIILIIELEKAIQENSGSELNQTEIPEQQEATPGLAILVYAFATLVVVSIVVGFVILKKKKYA